VLEAAVWVNVNDKILIEKPRKGGINFLLKGDLRVDLVANCYSELMQGGSLTLFSRYLIHRSFTVHAHTRIEYLVPTSNFTVLL